MNQVDWFAGFDIFSVRPPVWIVRQEHLEEDFEELKRRLGSEVETPPLDDPVAAHKTDYSDVPMLSIGAASNVQLWYWQDVDFYKHCEEWMECESSS
jgi:hypothetical protein